MYATFEDEINISEEQKKEYKAILKQLVARTISVMDGNEAMDTFIRDLPLFQTNLGTAIGMKQYF